MSSFLLYTALNTHPNTHIPAHSSHITHLMATQNTNQSKTTPTTKPQKPQKPPKKKTPQVVKNVRHSLHAAARNNDLHASYILHSIVSSIKSECLKVTHQDSPPQPTSSDLGFDVPWLAEPYPKLLTELLLHFSSSLKTTPPTTDLDTIFKWTKEDYRVFLSIVYGCSPSDYLGKGTLNKPVVTSTVPLTVDDSQPKEGSFLWDVKVEEFYLYLTSHPIPTLPTPPHTTSSSSPQPSSPSPNVMTRFNDRLSFLQTLKSSYDSYSYPYNELVYTSLIRVFSNYGGDNGLKQALGFLKEAEGEGEGKGFVHCFGSLESPPVPFRI